MDINQNKVSFKNLISNQISFTVGTHDGKYHADDVLACSLLRYMFGRRISFIRTRDPKILSGCDILVDVGGKFDGMKYFDHHQDQNLPCAVSLVWKAIMKERDFEIWEYVDKNVLEGISALDVDLMAAIETRGSNKNYYEVSSLVIQMNDLDCSMTSGGSDYVGAGFETAVSHTMLWWEIWISKARTHIKEKPIVQSAQYIGPNIILLLDGVDFYDHHLDSKIKYAIYPQYNKNDWILRSLNSRVWPIPKDISGAYYVHHSGFLALFNNKSDAVEAATNLCIKNL